MDNFDVILKELTEELKTAEKRIKTDSTLQNPKSLPVPKNPAYPCEFVTLEDPDTPPVTADVEELKQKYKAPYDVCTFFSYLGFINKILFDDQNAVLLSYCTFGDTDTADADPFATSIMTIYRAYGQHMRLLRRMIEREVGVTQGFTTVFRRNSMCTKMMTAYAKDTGQQYIVDTLGPVSREVSESKSELLEIELPLLKQKGVPATQQEQAIKNLLVRCQQVLNDILDNIEHCPGSFRYLCFMLQFYVKQKWPEGGDDPWLKAITGFFFLRFICPALVTPETYGLTNGIPDADTRRKFVLIAKVIQNLANATSFAGKVKEWQPVDDWIKSNSERILKFFHQLAAPPNSFLPFTVIPPMEGMEVLKAWATLQQMTIVKLKKMVRFIEHDYTRKSNLLEGDPKDIVRDLQTFSAWLSRIDFNGLVLKQEPGWKVSGLSSKLLADTLKADQFYKTQDSDLIYTKAITLNTQLDPDDPLYRLILKDAKGKSKTSESDGVESPTKTTSAKNSSATNGTGGTSADLEKQDGDQDKDPKSTSSYDSLASLKLLHPFHLSLRLLSELINLLKAFGIATYNPKINQEAKFRELRFSEKFRRFTLRCARLQKANVLLLNENELKCFWLNIYHLLYLHSYTLVGVPHSKSLHRTYFFNSFSYKIGGHNFCLKDIEELLRVPVGEEKHQYFGKNDGRYPKYALGTSDPRVWFSLSYFTVSQLNMSVFYTDTINNQLDRHIQDYVSDHVTADAQQECIFLPKLFEAHAEELRHYVQKKFNQKYPHTGYEWAKHLLSVEISSGATQTIITNCYDDLQKLIKKKPQFKIKAYDWTPKINLNEIQVLNIPPDPLDSASLPEEDKKSEGGQTRNKSKFTSQKDENGFPSVPWPTQKLDTMTQLELIEYIRVCKRALKQGATMYSDLVAKTQLAEEEESSEHQDQEEPTTEEHQQEEIEQYNDENSSSSGNEDA